MGVSPDLDTLRRLARSRDFLAGAADGVVHLEDAAREACLSPFHYHRLFTRAFGQTPHGFLTERRIDKARRLLATTDLSVGEVCLEVGYASLGTFSARFHRLVGCSPSDYRAGSRRFYAISGWRAHRFIPTCFVAPRLAVVRNGKIEEASAGGFALG